MDPKPQNNKNTTQFSQTTEIDIHQSKFRFKIEFTMNV